MTVFFFYTLWSWVFFLPCQNEFIYPIEMCTFVSNKIYCNRTANILKYMLWCVHRMFFSVLSAQVSILITFRWVSHIFLITRMIRRWTWINVEGTTTIILRLFDANPFQMHVYIRRPSSSSSPSPFFQTQQQLFLDDELNTWQKGGKRALSHTLLIYWIWYKF